MFLQASFLYLYPASCVELWRQCLVHCSLGCISEAWLSGSKADARLTREADWVGLQAESNRKTKPEACKAGALSQCSLGFKMWMVSINDNVVVASKN